MKLFTALVLVSFLSAGAQSPASKAGQTTAAQGAAVTKTATHSATKANTFDGWISDDRCGSHVNAECSQICVSKGAKIVFVGSDKSITPIANQESVKDFLGKHVTIQGKLDKGVLTVASANLAK